MTCKHCILLNNNKNDIMDKICPLCNSKTISLSLDDLRLLAETTKLKTVQNTYKFTKKLIENTRVRVKSNILCVK